MEVFLLPVREDILMEAVNPHHPGALRSFFKQCIVCFLFNAKLFLLLCATQNL